MANPQTAYDLLMRRITDQENRVKRQERLVAAMGEKGRSATQAEDLLSLMRAALDALRAGLAHYPKPD
jgi:hypothetical protein